MTLFTDPVAQVLIKNPKSGQEWKWHLPEFPFLTGVSIHYEMEAISTVEISVDAPYTDGIEKLLTPPTPFTVGNLIQARIGYASGLYTDWTMGHLLGDGIGLSVNANGVSGTVTFKGLAQSAFYVVDRSELRYLHNRGTHLDVIPLIAEAMGLAYTVSPGAQEALSGQTFDACVDETWWGLLKKICAENNSRWFIGPKPGQLGNSRHLFIWQPREEDAIAAALVRRKYVIRGAIDEANLQYPCLDWSPDGALFAAYLNDLPSPAAHGVKTSYIDTDEGEIIDVIVLPGDAPIMTYGYLDTTDPLDIVDEGVRSDKKIESDNAAAENLVTTGKPGPEGEAAVKAQVEKAQIAGNASQMGVISTLGLPEEQCGNKCTLHGAGAIFDGPYEVRAVSHVFANASYDMTLKVLRQGIGGNEKVDGEQKETTEGQVTP